MVGLEVGLWGCSEYVWCAVWWWKVEVCWCGCYGWDRNVCKPTPESDGFSGVLLNPRELFNVMCLQPTPTGGYRLGAGRPGVGGAWVGFYVTG